MGNVAHIPEHTYSFFIARIMYEKHTSLCHEF